MKETYETYPKVSYPMITIQEIANEPVENFWDGSKENVVYVAYQIGINAKQSDTLTAIGNVKKLASIIDTYMQGDRYKCMRRIGNLIISPLPSDNNVMVGYLRYEGNLELNTNTIYRRS